MFTIKGPILAAVALENGSEDLLRRRQCNPGISRDEIQPAVCPGV